MLTEAEEAAAGYWMEIAKVLARAGPCRRRAVGALIVGNWEVPERGLILGHGVNRGPEGTPSCLQGGCPRGQLSQEDCQPYTDYSNCHAKHAEHVALESAVFWVGSPGVALFVTEKPCYNCTELIKPAGLTTFIPGRPGKSPVRKLKI